MRGTPKKNENEQAIENNDHHSYSSHSNHYENKAFASSNEMGLNENCAVVKVADETPSSPGDPSTRLTNGDGVAKLETPACGRTDDYPISGLPLADSLMAYKIEHFGSKAPLVGKKWNGELCRRASATVEIVSDSNASPQDIILCPDTENVFLSRVSKRQSRGIQVWPTPPYRLKVLPKRSENEPFKFNVNLLRRWIFCQIGLSSLLVMWVIAGATAFRYTEGPWEEKVTRELVTKQKDLVTGLATELKQRVLDENSSYNIVDKYMSLHEQILAERNDGVGQGSGGTVWTFPGCILFAVSLITTLGFGAPVPRTSEGRGVAVIFGALGIPLHLLLVLNIGMAIAVRLQSYAHRRRKSDNESQCDEISSTEDKILEPRETGGIFSITRHKRSGSEPIGKQALNNIAIQTNFIVDNLKESKYFNIKESNKAKNLNEKIDFMHEDEDKSFQGLQAIPKWLKWLPFISIVSYYSLGFFLFGLARHKLFLDSLMFPLDFTVAGGVAHTDGYIRVLYAVYLQGAVILAATSVSVLQVTATQGLTHLGLKYGLITNSR